MPSESALDARMNDAVDRVGAADIVVGIPSYRNAATIGHVVRTVVSGLRRYFADSRCVVVNADGGSSDGTPDAVREAVGDHPAVVGAYVGPPGKGSAFRAIFEAGTRLGARAFAVVDSDLRSITPEWIERLVRPVVAGDAGYVTPLYARHKHDGTITNTIAYPLTRALYGARLRQPIGGEFGFSGDLARDFLEGGAFVPRARVGMELWESDVARFGIDIYMTTTALVRGAGLAQAALGAKVHDPKDPGADLAPMFQQVVGTAFRLAAANVATWTPVSGSREVPSSGRMPPTDVEAIAVDARALARRFHDGAPGHVAMWDEALSPGSAAAVRAALGEDVPHALAGAPWATIVYDLLAACARRPLWTDPYVRSLVPLYYGRVAALVDDARDMDTSGAESLVEAQALAFEEARPHLLGRLG